MAYAKGSRIHDKKTRELIRKLDKENAGSRVKVKPEQPNAYVVPLPDKTYQIIDATGTNDGEPIKMTRSELHKRKLPFGDAPVEIMFDFEQYRDELTRASGAFQREKGQAPIVQ